MTSTRRGRNGDVRPAMKSLKPYIKVMRPTQWVKNGFVLMPLVFSGRMCNFEDLIKVAVMLLAFCCVSSLTYIFNDYMDREQDRVHPLKKHRPIASGQVSAGGALLLAFGLAVVAALLSRAIQAPSESYLILVIYVVLHIVYSVSLKNIVIVDVITIALGFLLRVVAGAVVISVSVSSWLILCTFSVAIFLALGKRRHEVVILCADASCHRPVLENYSVGLLDQLLQVVTTSTFIFYCLYSVGGTGLQSEKMMFTIPVVAYGIFRYLYLIYQQEDGGSPTAMLLTDPPLMTCVIIWLTACVGIIYL
jgi:4-hydroxybenzoate polyprenyltransferase